MSFGKKWSYFWWFLVDGGDRVFQFTDTKSSPIAHWRILGNIFWYVRFSPFFLDFRFFPDCQVSLLSVWTFENWTLKKWCNYTALKTWPVLLSILCFASRLNLSSSPCNQRRSVSETSKCRPGQDTQLHSACFSGLCTRQNPMKEL